MSNNHTITPAHQQKVTLRIVESFPPHEPRETDVHYRYFQQAHNRLKAAGKLVCWIDNDDCSGAIELHHSTVEFALANGVDISEFEAAYPEFACTDEESFLKFVESEGNLTPLCINHHRGAHGIHSLTYPSWLPQKFWQKNTPAPAVSVTVADGDSATVKAVHGDAKSRSPPTRKLLESYLEDFLSGSFRATTKQPPDFSEGCFAAGDYLDSFLLLSLRLPAASYGHCRSLRLRTHPLSGTPRLMG